MLQCKNTMCMDQGHTDARDKVVMDILLGMVETSYTSLPLTGRAGGREDSREIIPGWSTDVEPYRLQSNAAYRCWLAAGKPRQGQVFQAKLHHHAQFRYAVRRVKRAAKLHQAQGLFAAAMNGDIELMKEMR